MQSEEKILEIVNEMKTRDLTDLKLVIVYLTVVALFLPFILGLDAVWTSNIIWLTAALSILAHVSISFIERK